MMEEKYPVIFENHWASEIQQAEMELFQIERERAICDIVSLIRRFDISSKDISEVIGEDWGRQGEASIKIYDPYFGPR